MRAFLPLQIIRLQIPEGSATQVKWQLCALTGREDVGECARVERPGR
jgi:hypothetical protein